MVKKEEQIFIGNDDMVVELLGKAKEEFIAEREKLQIELNFIKEQQNVKKEARENAIKKLAEIAGLTDEEIKSII